MHIHINKLFYYILLITSNFYRSHLNVFINKHFSENKLNQN